MTEWQPIETAPKAGTAIIVALQGGVTVTEWEGEKQHGRE